MSSKGAVGVGSASSHRPGSTRSSASCVTGERAPYAPTQAVAAHNGPNAAFPAARPRAGGRYPDRRDQLAELVGGTGLRYATHQAGVLADPPPEADRYGGTAVATRWPHRVVAALDHRPAGHGGVHWWTLAVSVQVPGLGELLFVVPTTPWRPDAEAARQRQAIEVAELDARHRAALPTVIAGDLNASPEAASIRFLSGLQPRDGRSVRFRDAWAVAGDGPGHTWPVDDPAAIAEAERVIGQPGHRRRIDYVFVGSARAHPRARARIVAARLVGERPVDGVWLSDHAGVLVDLDVEAAGASSGRATGSS